MCNINSTPDPFSQAIGSLLLQAASQAIAQIDWGAMLAQALQPSSSDIKTPADLRLWLCQQCANGQISPEALSQAMTLLIQMENAAQRGDRTGTRQKCVELMRVLP